MVCLFLDCKRVLCALIMNGACLRVRMGICVCVCVCVYYKCVCVQMYVCACARNMSEA